MIGHDDTWTAVAAALTATRTNSDPVAALFLGTPSGLEVPRGITQQVTRQLHLEVSKSVVAAFAMVCVDPAAFYTRRERLRRRCAVCLAALQALDREACKGEGCGGSDGGDPLEAVHNVMLTTILHGRVKGGQEGRVLLDAWPKEEEEETKAEEEGVDAAAIAARVEVEQRHKRRRDLQQLVAVLESSS